MRCVDSWSRDRCSGKFVPGTSRGRRATRHSCSGGTAAAAAAGCVGVGGSWVAAVGGKMGGVGGVAVPRCWCWWWGQSAEVVSPRV